MEPNLVFIVGCPRSGTTWLQKMLSMHPQVFTGQESDLFASYIGPQIKAWTKEKDELTRGGLGMGCYMTEEEFFAYIKTHADQLLEKILRYSDKPITVEKTPSHVLFIPEILRLYPKSKFINMVRHPYGVVASLLEASKNWGSTWAPSSLSHAIGLWKSHTAAAEDARSLLSKSNFLQVRYEDLKNNTVEWVSMVCEFIFAEKDPEVIRKMTESDLTNVQLPLFGEFGMKNELEKIPAGFAQHKTPKSLSILKKARIYRVLRNEMRNYGYT